MKRFWLGAGIVLLPIGWFAAGGGLGMIGHMTGHMIAVALAAPLIAYGLKGTRADPAIRWPRAVTPMAMMLVELTTVWLWHLPIFRRLAASAWPTLFFEQLSFLIAGLLLWSAVLRSAHRAAGVGALLLTSMHMTLLGALIGLAPRPLYPSMHQGLHGLEPLADQQLGGVVMLIVGAASYFIGGLALMYGIVREREAA
ncbi:cytochrome c oxidase assembly protein [Sphingobium sp.]|uniref:cytochrome c oxidase assembly protein n=1 Tax=Sphingobium sp. TaxID=1912891 RepID=UPI002C33E085|nr:cytochrome c oxidase assembly protein [Sphingobium sp.]HUD95409.1 cytochrome c oxidase assembly protein [Sphingobium sp.]